MANRPANAGSDRMGLDRGLAPMDNIAPPPDAAVALFVVSKGSAYALRGIAVLGGTLLAAALARFLLPNRFAGLLASRRKASDVLAFAVLGTALLAVALSLP